MPRPRRDDLRQETMQQIKTVALEQMREHGTGGITLRGIAREIGMSSTSSRYNYFANLDDLITALLVDAFNASADALAAASATVDDAAPVTDRLRAIFHAYRDWALANPEQFRLIYGNPIPGYHAPAEVTVPLAARSLLVLLEAVQPAYARGELHIGENFASLPPGTEAKLRQRLDELGFALPPEVLYGLVVGWARGHGMIMLELHGHTGPVVGDPAALYADEVERLLCQMIVSP